MKPCVRKFRLAVAAMATVAVLATIASCATVNRLGEFDFQGRTLAVEMRLPPEPEMDIHYNVRVDFHDPIATAFNVGSTIAKAANAERVDQLMRDALQVVDVPAIVRDESYTTCLSVLGAEQEDDPGSAEYLLDLDIHRYGVHAGSWNSAVSLRIRLTASLYRLQAESVRRTRRAGTPAPASDNGENALVWRRDIEVERMATPAMFGLDATIGNFVSTAALASLDEEALGDGFDQLARDTALSVARTLQDDLFDARSAS